MVKKALVNASSGLNDNEVLHEATHESRGDYPAGLLFGEFFSSPREKIYRRENS